MTGPARRPTVAFAGMTHLGLNSAVALAADGFSVICFDPESARVAALRDGRISINEPDLDDLVRSNADRLTFTDDPAGLALCDVCYVAPDVATDDAGTSDLGPIHQLVDTVDGALSRDATMVILSQVPPGFTRNLRRPATYRYYQVETLIFGKAIARARHPERYILGCEDPDRPLPPAFQTVLDARDCPILKMRYESAELAKIAINACLVASISAANSLAELCERIGADWREIVPALRLDRRIGAHAYIDPGLGIAGGNLERDLATVIRLASEKGTDSSVLQAWLGNSRHRRDWVLTRLHDTVLATCERPRLALLGLAYKEHTNSTKNAPALALLAALGNCDIRAYDPAVEVKSGWHPSLAQVSNSLAACRDADAVIVMTPWPEFAAIDPRELADNMRGETIIDPFGVFDTHACIDAGLSYHRLGAGPAADPKRRQ